MAMRRYLVLLLLLLAAGCISPPIQTGTTSQYEFPGLNNTTIFYLNFTSVQVVENVVNKTSVEFTVRERAETDFRNPVAVDYSGNDVSFNTSKDTIFSMAVVRLNFSSPFSGFVAYTQSAAQDFIYPLTKNASVRAVLPRNYTVSSFLGIAQPMPDSITEDAEGREVLIWEKPYPEHNSIRVKYIHRSIPTLVFYFVFSLLMTALFIAGYYYFSLSALRKRRRKMEKDVRK